MNVRKLTGSLILAGALAIPGLWLGLRFTDRVRADESVEKDSSSTSLLGSLAGTASCSARACHGGLEPVHPLPPGQSVGQNEYTRWLTNGDKHADAYQVLFGERSQRIVKNLNRKAESYAQTLETMCLPCHTNPLAARSQGNELALEERQFGVGCEACHGSAVKWLGPHTKPPWKTLNPKQQREEGMMPVVADLAARAEVCAGCHVGAPPGKNSEPRRDVNHDLIAAGHPRLNFELGAFFANLPPHWERKPTSGDEARIWAIGQIVAAEAALELLADRAGTKNQPWPEFAEYDCYACHHDLHQPSNRQRRGYGGRAPGSLPWGTWYFALSPALAPKPSSLDDLARTMGQPYPNRQQVVKQAHTVLGALHPRSADWAKIDLNQGAVEKLLRELVQDDRKVAASSWDGAEQLYLAIVALNQAFPDPRLEHGLRDLAAKRAFQNDFGSPKGFEPDVFYKALADELKKPAK
jgi:mono/diheme cytochrome c family protein